MTLDRRMGPQGAQVEARAGLGQKIRSFSKMAWQKSTHFSTGKQMIQTSKNWQAKQASGSSKILEIKKNASEAILFVTRMVCDLRRADFDHTIFNDLFARVLTILTSYCYS